MTHGKPGNDKNLNKIRPLLEQLEADQFTGQITFRFYRGDLSKKYVINQENKMEETHVKQTTLPQDLP